MTTEKNKKSLNKFNIIVIISIIIFSVGIVKPTLQNDTFYTIQIGKYIIENGIDMMEHFSWHKDLSYTYPHWIYDIIVYSIYNIFDFIGIYFFSIILSIILGISIYYILAKFSKNNLISFLVTLLIMFLGRVFITARAQLVTFILFIWTIYFIEKFLETKKIRYAIKLILIPILIANIHAAVFPFYFMLYMPYIAEYIVAIIAERINKKVDKKNNYNKIIIEKNDAVLKLILIMIVCLFTGLITPIGNTPYTYLINTMLGNTTQNIEEHLPLVLYKNKEMLLAFFAVFSMIGLTDCKIKLKDLFMIIGLTFLSFMSTRQISMFIFIGGISINNILCNFLDLHNSKKDTEQMIEKITTILGMLVTFLLLIIVTISLWIKMKDDKIIDYKSYPEGACNYIINNLDINKIKLFNDYDYGSYLIYKGIPVFIDSRADVYDPKFNKLEDDIFQDYIETYNLRVYYEDTFNHYDITHVLLYKNSQLALYVSKNKNYKIIYLDENFVIFERVNNN